MKRVASLFLIFLFIPAYVGYAAEFAGTAAVLQIISAEEASGELSVEVKLDGPVPAGKVLLAMYDKNDCLAAMLYQDASASNRFTWKGRARSVKAMLWDGTETVHPLAEAAAAIVHREIVNLTPLISSVTAGTAGSDASGALLDGHPDTGWKGYASPDAPQNLILEFGGRTVSASRLMITCVRAAAEGVQTASVEAKDEEGQWRPVCGDTALTPLAKPYNAETERFALDIPAAKIQALKLTVTQGRGAGGAFQIADLHVTGDEVEYPAGSAERTTVQAKSGELVTLPDTVAWHTPEDTSIPAPVQWEQKQVFCSGPGRIEISGWIGSWEKARAVIEVSAERVNPALDGHWAAEALEKLNLRGVFGGAFSELSPDAEIRRSDLAAWLYRGLSLDRDYLPERVELSKGSLLTDTDAAEPNELAAFGILTGDSLRPAEGLSRLELAGTVCRALRYEKDSEVLPREPLRYTDAGQYPDPEALETLAAADIISNEGTFRGGDAATNAEALCMLSALLDAVKASKVYPMPEDAAAPRMADYTVKVDGREAGTYLTYGFPGMAARETEINGRAATAVGVSYFDFAGEAEVEITLHNPALGDASALKIRPLSLEIVPAVTGNTIRFKLYQPCNISIEPWGLSRPLQLFANPMEKGLPDFEADNVRYFGPGVHYIDPVSLSSGETVYIDGGAVVYVKPQESFGDGGEYYGIRLGQIEPAFAADGTERVTVRGRGILSGHHAFEQLQRHQMLRIHASRNFSADGIILLESSAWNVFVAAGSDGVYLNNLKMVGFFANNDGIDFCDSNNGVVENCYANNADDSFIIKAWWTVNNVRFQNCAAWNNVSTSFGAVCELYQPVTNVSFSDCTVLHSTNPLWTPGSGGVIGIWDHYAGDVSDMTFENLVIEDAAAGKELVKINVDADPEQPDRAAEVKDITFRDIRILDARDSRISLTTPFAGGIHDILFERLEWNNKIVTALDRRFILQNAKDITVRP